MPRGSDEFGGDGRVEGLFFSCFFRFHGVCSVFVLFLLFFLVSHFGFLFVRGGGGFRLIISSGKVGA